MKNTNNNYGFDIPHKLIAYCLYRVSTAGQVDKVKNDIPMQKEECREFAARHGWIIGKEFLEKGVSGFKVSAEKRDAIQDLKAAAVRGEFQILLVFMFDRIGRIDDETPFIVEWFVKHGIQVWSTQEGEQKFETHVDKLLNYIRFWQASGESEKTSIRIKTRLHQLSAEGIYTGGPVPFGYCTVKNGRLNKKGREVLDLAVEPREAEWVKKLYEKTVDDGMGSYQLAELLNNSGMRTHTGAKFQAGTVLRILRNKMNLGYARNSNMELPYLEHLQIIDEITFDRAQFILDQRSKVDNEKRTIARQSKSKNMLSGIMFCGHCGHRLTSLVYHEKYIRRDGSVYDRKQLKYLCYHKSRGLCKCDGQSTYVAERVDNAIIAYMHKMFQNIKNSPDEAELKKSIERSAAESKAAQDLLNLELQKNSDQLITLHDQVSATLNGDGVYTTEQLSTAIRTVEARIYSIRDKIEELQSEVDYKRVSLDQMKPMFEQLLSWAQAFDNSSIAQKKMIISHMLSSIKLYKDYKIVIELNEDYKYLCENWDNLAAETTIYA